MACMTDLFRFNYSIIFVERVEGIERFFFVLTECKFRTGTCNNLYVLFYNVADISLTAQML